LRNDQHLGPRVYRRQIELALAVREYPQVGDLVGHQVDFRLGVAGPYA
jgi:hypothetical protein